MGGILPPARTAPAERSPSSKKSFDCQVTSDTGRLSLVRNSFDDREVHRSINFVELLRSLDWLLDLLRLSPVELKEDSLSEDSTTLGMEVDKLEVTCGKQSLSDYKKIEVNKGLWTFLTTPLLVDKTKRLVEVPFSR
ncbi:Uncharacterized protein Fot_28669 [Forsythia ovata]|uniref:Uncharacterized protein n=1 Tax=Forsythia ovata TaxID=205694 RepID=A0ABD1TQ59_9LAMI